MSLDEKVVTDRLCADALAADLRISKAFLQSTTKVAWAEIEVHVQERASAYCEELHVGRATRERAIDNVKKFWQELGGYDGPLRSVSVLSRAATKLLRPKGREMVLQVDPSEPGREILRWRFVSLALPPGILIAAATPAGVAQASAVRLLDASIAPDHPVAHHHVHHAATMSFEDLWASLRFRALLEPGDLLTSLRHSRSICPELHQGESPCPWGRSESKLRRLETFPLRPSLEAARARHMAQWGDLIRQAYIARHVLDFHSFHTNSLQRCSHRTCQVGRVALRSFLQGRTRDYNETGSPFPWPDELVRLASRSRKVDDPDCRHDEQLPLNCGRADERSLVKRAFARLNPYGGESPDTVYENLFMQYLRIKTVVFRLLVHPPGERGLHNFLEHFEQIKVYAPESDKRPPPLQLEPGLKVWATEYRVAPDAWFNIIGRHTAKLEGRAKERPASPEFAWLIHFKRKAPTDQPPLFGAAIRQMESEADEIARALKTEPILLRRLRGIDICGVEDVQPLWVAADTLRRLRESSRTIAASRPGLRIEPLRLTLHAGEDFRWLTSGLRAIAEPFRWGLIERGDRIGHGIAITLDPKEWRQQNKRKKVCISHFDRLLDLAFLATYTKRRTAAQERWLRNETKKIVVHLRLEAEDISGSDLR